MTTQTPKQFARANAIQPRDWYKGSKPRPGRSRTERRFKQLPCPKCHRFIERGYEHECKPVADTQYKKKSLFTHIDRVNDSHPTHGY